MEILRLTGPEISPESGMGHDNSNGTFVIKYWHIGAFILVQLALFSYGYGRITQSTEELARRLNAIDRRGQVSREEFKDFRDEVRDDVRRLHDAINRIGDK